MLQSMGSQRVRNDLVTKQQQQHYLFYCLNMLLLHMSSSVQFSHSVMSNSSWSHGLQHARLPCPLPTPRAYSNSCPSSQWCHPTISSSAVTFSSCLQSFPALPHLNKDQTIIPYYSWATWYLNVPNSLFMFYPFVWLNQVVTNVNYIIIGW